MHLWDQKRETKIFEHFKGSFPFLEEWGNPADSEGANITITPSRPVEHDSDSDKESQYEDIPEKNFEESPPPDGGLVAWLQVAACWILNTNSWGILNMFGVYQEYYQTSFLSHKSPGDISWIGALSQCCCLFGTVIFAFPMDAGYMKSLAIAGTFLQFLALMLLGSLCRSYWSIMLVQGAFIGLNCSIFYIVSLGCVAPYFSKKRPLAMSLGTCGAALGAVIYSCMARRLIDSVGFTWATRATAFVQLGSCLFMCAVIRQRLSPRRRTGIIAFECFTEPKFMLFSCANFFAFSGLFTFFFHFESFALFEHPEEKYLQYTTAIVNSGSVVGRVAFGIIASYYGNANVLVITLICSAILGWCWIPVKSEGSIIALALLFGCATGATCSLPGPMVAYLTSDFSRLGIRMAVLFLFEGTGILLGPPFAGIMERNHSWFWPELYCGMLMTAGAVLFFCCRQFLTHNKLRVII